MLRWDDPVGFVHGATPPVRKAWQALGIATVGDLLLTLPRRYDDFSKTVPISRAETGEVVTIRGKVVKASRLNTFRKRFQIIRVTVRDDSGSISANFFNQPWLLEELKPGRDIFLSGKIALHERYGKQVVNPLWEAADGKTIIAGRISPVYGLSGSLVQKTYRRLLPPVLETVEWPSDTLDEAARSRLDLLPFTDAVRQAHLPQNQEDAEGGRRRLAFDELLIIQLAMTRARMTGTKAGAPRIAFDEAFAKKFVGTLPFPLTGDQKRASWACLKDLEGEIPMRRLIQGDVGSGKTAVAAFLSAFVHRNGSSAVLLAPTDILARQHAATFRRLLAPFHVPSLLITRTDKILFEGQEQAALGPEELTRRLQAGNIVLVGTHALLEEGRLPPDIALAIVDEQHRFGVSQREALIKNVRPDGLVPHFLSMTATPIPRSLALAVYGDLDISVIREKPPGRQSIATQVLRGEDRETAYAAIREAVKRGERAYVVCPLVDASDALGVRSATDEAKRLAAGPLKGVRIGLLHGRMKPGEKDDVMTRFSAGDLDVLVSTTVIEVGVDVPQATVIAIEGAERFGLAQLHQLRGRVGRSDRASNCFLLTDSDGPSLERLRIVERTQDGFLLAEEDLKLRGAGKLFGTEQSGFGGFQIARLSDTDLMGMARTEAERLIEAGVDESSWPLYKRLHGLTTHLE